MTSPYITLASGARFPLVGLGLWKLEDVNVEPIVSKALEVGYRHLDSACDYGNETVVGAVLDEQFETGRYQRDDVWVTSKLWNTYHSPEHVRPAIERSLHDLRLDYLDLYLIHFPIAQRFVPFEQRYPPGWFYDPESAEPKMEFDSTPLAETWHAMEQLVDAGLTRHIGICNYNTGMLRDLLNYARIPPAVLQVELHPLLTQEKLVRFAQESGIAVTAFSPLGSPSYVPLSMAEESESLLENEEVNRIADEHSKSPAQVVLRWGVQRGTAVIPKTSKASRLEENFNLFDFELSSEEMETISGFNRDRRFNDPGVFCEQAFNTFCPIYD